MTIKHTLFAMLAMVVLPAVALAQPVTPPVTPAPNTANIAVGSFFSDGNPNASVVVSLTCLSGTIAPSSATLGDGEGQIFVVSNIPTGEDNPCSLTQTAVNYYDTEYLCDPTAAIAGDVQCGNPSDLSTTSCSWSNVVADKVGYCAVYNTPEPVKLAVNKVWDITNSGGDNVNTATDIIIKCDSKIIGGYYSNGVWSYQKAIVGDATVTVAVYPDYEGSECEVMEPDLDSAVEIENGCTSVDIELGKNASCTITNTVFFEGIPTLNQYGMAIMALLMLGVGFVGFRRFV